MHMHVCVLWAADWWEGGSCTDSWAASDPVHWWETGWTPTRLRKSASDRCRSSPVRPRRCYYYYYYVYFFQAHQHKATGRRTRLDIQNYGCNSSLLCDHGAVERNRISSLQSHGKVLEKECCLPDVFCDSGGTPANLLCELNGHLMLLWLVVYKPWVLNFRG